MSRYLNKYLAVALIWIVLAAMPAGNTYAQEDTVAFENAEPEGNRSLTPTEWDEISNDKDFTYRDSVEYKKLIEPKTNRNSGFSKLLQALFRWIGSTVGQVIVWGLLLLIVLYAVYKIIGGELSGIFGRKSKPVENADTQPDTEDITETNWETLLRDATKAGDLRLAVRYSYMQLLQILQHNALIQYRNDKTNYEYYSELSGTPYKQPFRRLSRQYEYTWYGNFPIDQDTYDNHMGTLNDLKKQLGA